jgi:hypothetical protein
MGLYPELGYTAVRYIEYLPKLTNIIADSHRLGFTAA